MNRNIFFFLFFCSLFSRAQSSFIHPLSYNPVISAKYEEVHSHANRRSAIVNDTLSLPFLDDFSVINVFPDSAFWTDSSVYINTDFPIAPLTIGVATFDGLNSHGYPYDFNVSQISTGYADKLTSKPIDLNIPTTDTTVYLSFFYQPQGRGNAPETRDSLMLQFKDTGGVWQKVWSKEGSALASGDSSFHIVMINVKSSFFYKGFQFRFQNKATLSGSLDHWNIDYVYLNRTRLYDDTIMKDVAFVYRPVSLLKNYQSMPFNQYSSSEMKTNMEVYLRNNDVNLASNKYKFVISDISGPLYSSIESNTNISPYYSSGYQNDPNQSYPAIGYVFPAMPDTASFLIQHITTAGLADMESNNDTAYFRQVFYNYYAYDDGTAEAAYGPGGVNPAMLAYEFNLTLPDTLRALNIFFNPVLKNQSSSPFQITVWDNNGGKPGNVIYQGNATFPVYKQQGNNVFETYMLDSAILLPAGTFFAGWKQLTTEVLNIGYDRNINTQNKIFYNIDGNWQNSTDPGSLMLRPVFGKKFIPTGINEYSTRVNEVKLFPNPANNQVTIYSDNNSEIIISIYDALGREAIKTNGFYNQAIDVSSLNSGLFFITITDPEKGIFTGKLAITR